MSHVRLADSYFPLEPSCPPMLPAKLHFGRFLLPVNCRITKTTRGNLYVIPMGRYHLLIFTTAGSWYSGWLKSEDDTAVSAFVRYAARDGLGGVDSMI